jgi:peptidoglycan/LPS O-acetylase OafA/YrhL
VPFYHPSPVRGRPPVEIHSIPHTRSDQSRIFSSESASTNAFQEFGSKLRIKKLDSVRGIAAMMVVLGHCYGAAISPLIIYYHAWPLLVFWDGSEAVPMFFVLSGYVLAVQILTNRVHTYAGFVVRRFFRIWPAFALIILAACGGFVVLAAKGVNFSNAPIAPSVSLQSLFSNLFMIGQSKAIDPPAWSLFVEMRASLVFPIIMYILFRTRFSIAVCIGLIFSIAGSRLVHADWLGLQAEEIGDTSKFIWLFVVGAGFAFPGNPIVKAFGVATPVQLLFALVIGITLIEYRFFPYALPAKNYVPMIGVIILFLICLQSRLAAVILERKSFLFLGRVSYGLYLIHWPILIVFGALSAFYGYDRGVGIATIIVSIILAWLINVAIETPMIKVGRRISTALEPA